MAILRWLLFPFAVLYGWLMRVRNRQFDTKSRYIVEFDRPVISVGNLSVGGTGKTPMIEWLIRLLRDRYALATISRGYGRKTRGFRLAGPEDDAATLGDEPYQFYRKFGNSVLVSVCEERILAVPQIVQDHEEVAAFLLDDAYQHRKIGRDLNIMLTEFARPFYEDYVVPTGRLREERRGASRAEAIVVTKCPTELSEEVKEDVTKRIRAYNEGASVYFSHIGYDQPQLALGSDEALENEVILVTGIAQPGVFLEEVEKTLTVIRHFDFQDHYAFGKSDLNKIETTVKESQKKLSLITTEKDMVRLLSLKDHSLFEKVSLFYMPIKFVLDREEEFSNQVLKVFDKN
jgi:tetraacyldisaccharide 4'-kinase